MNRIPCIILFSSMCLLNITVLSAQEVRTPDDLFKLNIEEFLNVKVVSVSKKSEEIFTAPGTVYVITKEELNRFGFQFLQDALQYVPSVYLYNPHSWVWGGQRGFVSNFSQTLLLINGREVNNLIAQEGFISRQFATHNIERIEVVASPGSALYGANALAGVINIITHESNPDFKGMAVSLDAGSFNTTAGSVVFGTSVNGLSIKGSYRQFNSDEEDFLDFVRDTENYSKGWVDNQYAHSYITDYKNPSEAVPVTLQIDYNGLYAGLNYYFNKQSHGLEKVRWDYTDSEDYRKFTLWYGGFKKNINEAMSLSLEYQHIRSFLWGRYHAGYWPDSRLQSSGIIDIYTFPDYVTTSSGVILHGLEEIKDYYSSFAEYLIDQGLIDPNNITEDDIRKYFSHIYTNKNSNGSQRQRFDLLWSWTMNEKASLDLGYVYDTINYVGLAVTDAALALGATYDIPLDLSKRDDVYDSIKHGAFFQLNYSLLESSPLWFNCGLRYDQQNHYGSSVNPRVGLVWQPKTDTIVKLLYGEAFREPNVFELSGDPNLEPAKLRSYELNVSQNVSDWARFSITGYHNTVTQFISSVGSLIGSNIGTVEEQEGNGLEFNFHLKKKAFLAFINGSLLFDITQTIRNSETGTLEESDVLGIPHEQYNLGLSYNFRIPFTLSLLYHYASNYDTLSGNAAFSEAFTIDAAHELRFTVQFGDLKIGDLLLDGFLTVKNLTDEENYQANIRRSGPNVFLQEGRSIMMRVRLRQ
ncbi:TonB-dependent receptor plug domain-containing protein [candidate division CSSED10-310 bacterium]|uniref:TonB-dependent receptor plug domain-containing protein n=1 Tax=candidate division CSSED10-310 bacterium TaxID=2855610 RepID=A0ABV6Z168_UNCC1